MSDSTIISWTDYTFNPWIGCNKVSLGCTNCYAERLTRDRMGKMLWGNNVRQITSEANWQKPRKWNREAEAKGIRQRVFCGSLMDWAEEHPICNKTRERLFNLIGDTPALDWQLLTKRAEKIRQKLPADWNDGWPNVWLGVSIETNEYVSRATELASIPAVIHFVSYEPALGSIKSIDLSGIEWLICGGESGPNFRQMNLAWAREARDLCLRFGTAFFFKQSSGYRTELGTSLDGKVYREFPSQG